MKTSIKVPARPGRKEENARKLMREQCGHIIQHIETSDLLVCDRCGRVVLLGSTLAEAPVRINPEDYDDGDRRGRDYE